MIRKLRVAVLAADAARQRGLGALVEAAGHELVADAADVLLADADALPPPEGQRPIPVVALGGQDTEARYAGQLSAAPTSRQIDAALRAAAAGLEVRARSQRPSLGFRAADEAPAPLTPREAEILSAIGLGLSNKEVARRLGISAHTVKFHLEAAFRKLGAASRAEAVAKGLRRGLIEV